MPIYEYQCLSCGIHFEEMQKMSDPPLTECKLCKGNVRKLLGTPALQFKGSGWYITDYAGKSPKPENGKPEGSNTEKKEEGKAEAKSAPSCSCPGGSCGQSS